MSAVMPSVEVTARSTQTRAPKAFELRPPLKAHVSLMATSYQATFL